MDELRSFEILLVEDDPADVELTHEGLKDSKMPVHLAVVDDGVNAIKYLKRETPFADAGKPDLIILDLNLPRKDGREVLKEIKSIEHLRHIPVIILTTSQDTSDIKRCYEWGANCWISKPIGLDDFITIVKQIHDFWLTVAKIPSDPNAGSSVTAEKKQG